MIPIKILLTLIVTALTVNILLFVVSLPQVNKYIVDRIARSKTKRKNPNNADNIIRNMELHVLQFLSNIRS